MPMAAAIFFHASSAQELLAQDRQSAFRPPSA